MLSIKKDHCVKYITLIFLAVFMLLRVTQYYSPAPVISRRSDTYQSTGENIYLHSQRMNIVSVWDKYILEIKNDTTIPKIKFSGMVLYLMFLGQAITLLLRRKANVYQAFIYLDHQRCAKLCIFRL